MISNFYGKETIFELPKSINFRKYKSEILISNYKDASTEFERIELRPYESIVYYIKKEIDDKKGGTC